LNTSRRADDRDVITMVSALVILRHITAIFRRYGVIAAFAALVIVSLAALAMLGAMDRRHDAVRANHQASLSAADRAQAILDHQQRSLDALARIAATQSDTTVQLYLDQLPASAPGIRGAAIADAAGAIQSRSTDGIDDLELAVLTADAAKIATTHVGGAPILVTQTIRDADTRLLGLAQPWLGTDGRLAGIALLAVDRNAFAGLDLVRGDGTPLFGDNSVLNTQRIALGDFPLMLSVPSADTASPMDDTPFIALALLGGLGLLSLLAALGARRAATQRWIARQAAAESELREALSTTAAAADRTDELNRTKSQFFAQVTHELRTPLNAIIGFSETIKHEIFGPVANPRYLEYAGLIHNAGTHLLSLINDLLDEARIEAGKMEIVPIRLSAPALARSTLDLVELLAVDRDIELATTGLGGCPDLNVDPRAMKQVLVNLLSNAIKYTPPGGRVELRFAPHEDGAVIEISDTGIGMSPDDLRVAFEPFGRAGSSEARQQQGTGLGLALARALVRLHGGELTLASQLDFGTTATITLPPKAVFANPTPSTKPEQTPRAAKAA
jgi:signal transduction histidine kinase